MKLGELLNTEEFKARKTVTVSPDEPVSAAVQKLAEYNKGSLPVCGKKGEPLGIITERDIVRKCFVRGTVSDIPVREVMTEQIVIGTPDDDLDYAINAMKQKKIRHLPVIENNKVIGIISMRDLLGIRLEHANTQIRLLDEYISGGVA